MRIDMENPSKTQLTVQEAAAYLGVDPKAVYAYIHNGEMPNAWNKAENPAAERPRYRIPVSDLEAFKRARTVKPAPKPVIHRRRRRRIPDLY
jgi:hypothetical protein